MRIPLGITKLSATTACTSQKAFEAHFDQIGTLRYSLKAIFAVTAICGASTAWYLSLAEGAPELYAVIIAAILSLWLFLWLDWPIFPRLLLSAFVAMVGVSILVPMSHLIKVLAYGPSLEYRALSGIEFRILGLWRGLELGDATNISSFENYAPDGFERFLRATMSLDQYMKIRREQDRTFASKNLNWPECAITKQLRRSSDKALTPPSYWPTIDAPKWWIVNGPAGSPKRNAIWDVEFRCGNDYSRACGLLIYFDVNSSTFWMLEWNRQHTQLQR